jgi:OmpA-OmpF porin, OOP family
MTNRYMLGAGVALAVAWGGVQVAQAQFLAAPRGPGAFYFGGEGGWTDLTNDTDTFSGPPLNTGHPGSIGSASANFKDGFNAGGRVGYQWGPWRFEEEYRFQQSDYQSLGGLGPGVIGGDRSAHAVMTNLIYDFTFGWPITPHIGAGLGVVDVVDSPTLKASIYSPTGALVARPGGLLHADDWEFGYQAIAGVEYNFNPVIALDVDYRYLATTDESYVSKSGLFTGQSYKSGYASHNLVASLIVRFGAPPPPPPAVAPPAPPAAAPPPPRNVYLVFFDWDRYNITPEGMSIIQQAANQFKSGAPVTLQVTGYTDLSGSAGYNQRLSERRANAVANAMVRFGVPRSDMVVTGRGMNNPRVPTAPGVREPQNRRVEIVFP